MYVCVCVCFVERPSYSVLLLQYVKSRFLGHRTSECRIDKLNTLSTEARVWLFYNQTNRMDGFSFCKPWATWIGPNPQWVWIIWSRNKWSGRNKTKKKGWTFSSRPFRMLEGNYIPSHETLCWEDRHHWNFCCCYYGPISVYVCVCMYVVCSLRTSVKNGLFTSHEDEVFHRGIATSWLGVSAWTCHQDSARLLI